MNQVATRDETSADMEMSHADLRHMRLTGKVCEAASAISDVDTLLSLSQTPPLTRGDIRILKDMTAKVGQLIREYEREAA